MKGAALSTTLLDPLQRPSACNAMRNGKTRYDARATLDGQETTRFKQHPPSLRAQEKMEIRVYGRGHPAPQVWWFCARSFKTAVGSRLKDPEASEGLV